MHSQIWRVQLLSPHQVQPCGSAFRRSIQMCACLFLFTWLDAWEATDGMKVASVNIVHQFLKPRLVFVLLTTWFQNHKSLASHHTRDNPPFGNMVWPIFTKQTSFFILCDPKWVTEAINPSGKCFQRPKDQKSVLQPQRSPSGSLQASAPASFFRPRSDVHVFYCR